MELCSLKVHLLKSQPPGTSECDGSRVVAAVISKEEVTLDGAGWDLKASMAGLRKTGNFGHTD